MKNKIGRPTKYRPEYCQKYIEESKKGNCLTEIASDWDVPRQRLYEWAQEHEDFRDAIKVGREHLRSWYHKLFKNITVGKIKNANVTAAIFLSKNAANFTDNPAVDPMEDQITDLRFE